MDRLHFVYPFIHHCTTGWIPSPARLTLAIVNSASMKMYIQVFDWLLVFNSLECTPSSGIAGSHGNSMLPFWGKKTFKLSSWFSAKLVLRITNRRCEAIECTSEKVWSRNGIELKAKPWKCSTWKAAAKEPVRETCNWGEEANARETGESKVGQRAIDRSVEEESREEFKVCRIWQDGGHWGCEVH